MLKKKAGVNGKVKHMKRSRTDVIYDGIIFIFLTLIFWLLPIRFILLSSHLSVIRRRLQAVK